MYRPRLLALVAPALALAAPLRAQVQLYSAPGPLTEPARASGLTATWEFQNTGSTSQTLNLSCYVGGVGEVTSCSVQSSQFLPSHSIIPVTVTFSTGSVSGTGSLTLQAFCGSCSFSYFGGPAVSVAVNGPVVSTVQTNGDYRDVSKCIADCFDAVASYTTPPYISADVPHSVRLVYRSAQAHPMGVVQVDARDTSSVSPVKMSLQLYTPQGTWVTFTNGSTEIFYNWVSHPTDGNVNRLAAQFDASGLATGAYNYTAVVRSYRSDGGFVETDLPARVLIANEAASPFGAGWSIAGLQRGYLQTNNGVVITEGNGSIAYFARGGTSCNGSVCTISYTSPKGDFTTFEKDSGGTCGNPPCPTYQRAYPGGSTVGFDANLKIIALGGYRFVGYRYSTFLQKQGPFIYYFPRARFGYNAANLLVAILDSIGNTDSLRYDANNHLRAIKDPGGRIDSITIDGSGNLAQIQDWEIRWNNLSGRPIQFQYDGNHRLVHWSDRRGGAFGIAYDFAGKVAADTAPQVTVNGQLVRPVVALSSIERTVLIDPASGKGTSSNPGSDVDTAVVRASLTNARGYVTTYALDRFGAATLVQEPLGRTTSFTLDSNSAVVRQVLPSGHVTTYTWVGPDLMQTVDSNSTTGTGRTIHYRYAAHQVDSVYGDVDSVVNHWTGNVLDSTHIGGAGWIKDSFALDGRLCGIVDPGGHRETCYFTSTGGFRNTDSVAYMLGTVRYRYDGHGQPVMTIDQVRDTTQTVYDSLGRVVQTIGPLHETTRTFYDGLYVTKVADAKGDTVYRWPNALGWPDSTKDPAGNKDRYQYDLNGNRTSWTTRNGRTITYKYDALDRPDTVVADGKMTTSAYDPAGHYQVDSNSESLDTLRFDLADRPRLAISCRVLVSGSAPSCFRDSLAYETRDVDTLSVLSAPSITSFLVRHHYDVHELLDTLTPGYLSGQTKQPIKFVYSAEALDSVRTLTGLNNLTVTHSYPWTHRTDQVQLSDPTLTAALGTAYAFDSAGRMATRYHGSLANPDTTRTLSYSRQGALVWYADSSHQSLTSCSFYPWIGYHCTSSNQASFADSTRYVYDSVGNRKDPSALNGGIGPANRLVRWQNFRMDYDAAGNMIHKRTLSTVDTTQVLRTDSLFWSALGRLDSVRTHVSSDTVTRRVGFGYDGWGRRVRKSSANGTSRYLWDGDALLAELDTLGHAVAEYTYYPGLDNVATVLRHDRADSTYYYVQDHSGNVLALLARTSSGVTIDNQYRYDPFGNPQGSSPNPVPNTLQFAGREYDTETQLHYDRARYLDPALGRFVSEDPLGLNGGINPYTFVGNDPINGSDPSGTRKICGPFKVVEEGIGEHLAIGWELTAMANASGRFSGDPRGAAWWALKATVVLGFVHELLDHDLTDAPGAPCNGLVDIAAFALVPFLAWKFGFDALPLGSIPVPPFPGGMLPPPQNWLPRPPWSQLPQPPPGVLWPGIIL